MDAPEFRIRPYEPRDHDAAYAVCLQTGDVGKDATHLYDDPMVLGHLYVGPYLRFEPALSFVLEDRKGVCGYVFGTSDSARFWSQFTDEWLPPLQAKHPAPKGPPESWTLTERIYHEFHHPSIFFPESLKAYPAHMHIDLIARAQGKGWGKRMVDTWLDRLRNHCNASGVHLCMSEFNERAGRFYQRLGFTELARAGQGDDRVIIMGMKL